MKKTTILVATLLGTLATHGKDKLTTKLGQPVDAVPSPYYLNIKGETVKATQLYNLVDNIKVDDKTFVPKKSLKEYSTGSAIYRRYLNKVDVRKIYTGKLTIWSSEKTITNKPEATNTGKGGTAKLLNAISVKPEDYEQKSLYFTEELNDNLYTYRAVNLEKFIPKSNSAYRHIDAYHINRTKSTVMKIAGCGLLTGGLVYSFSNVGKSGGSYSQGLMLGAVGAGITFWSRGFNTTAHRELNLAVAEYNEVRK